MGFGFFKRHHRMNSVRLGLILPPSRKSPKGEEGPEAPVRSQNIVSADER